MARPTTFSFICLFACLIGCAQNNTNNPVERNEQSNAKDTFHSNQHEEKIVINKKYISYNARRKELSLEYLKTRHGLIQSSPVITPRMIVLHYTGGGTFESNFNYFNQTEIEAARENNRKQSKLNVSAHFLIDRDGSIYQLMDDTSFARHTIGLNYCAIGIENVGNEKNPLTKEQVAANVQLIRHLCKKHRIEYLIGHSEYTKFRNTPLWKETDPNYINNKADPGDNFLKQVRDQIKDLNLKYKP
jgi:N-acetyl-anhydromuramyl-L-alanine amidase AmpD